MTTSNELNSAPVLSSIERDEARLRVDRYHATRKICALATDAKDAALLLDVLGLDPNEGRPDATVTLSLRTVAAVRSSVVGGTFNRPTHAYDAETRRGKR